MVVHAGSVRLLIVEDDAAIATPLMEGLQRAGYETIGALSGAEAFAQLPQADLILLDLGLPDIDGSEVCRRIRAVSAVPIIVVSARGEESERVLAFELGADDYVVKPFGLRELIARIGAVSRRTRPVGEPPVAQRIGPLEIDRRTRRTSLGGTQIDLTPKEFDLLAILAEDPGSVMSRHDIMTGVWDPHWYGPTKTLDVHVASLRKKLGDPGWVETVRGIGFRLRDR